MTLQLTCWEAGRLAKAEYQCLLFRHCSLSSWTSQRLRRVFVFSKMVSRKSAGMGVRRPTGTTAERLCWSHVQTPLSSLFSTMHLFSHCFHTTFKPRYCNSPQFNSTLSTWLTHTTPPPLCPQPSSTSPQSLHRMVYPFSSAGRSCQVSQPLHKRAQPVRASYSWATSPT